MDRMKRTDLFSSYRQEKNPEHWRGFSEVMWDLGFEMDCYRSKPECESFSQEGHSEKEIQDHILTEMLKWNTQEVGNYIFTIQGVNSLVRLWLSGRKGTLFF